MIAVASCWTAPRRRRRWTAAWTTGWAVICVLAGTPGGIAADPAPTGRFVDADVSGPIPHPAGLHPMYSDWLYCVGRPVVMRFHARPNTSYQVFVGLTEVHWDSPGQRVVDLEVGGAVVATVDTFAKAKATPGGYLYLATTDAAGDITVRVRPHPGSPDRNPVVCGALLFDGAAKLDVDAIVHGRGPAPRVSLLAGDERSRIQRRLANRGAYFPKKKYVPEPLPVFAQTRAKLPAPIFDENPDAVRCYWKSWELAFDHFRRPAPGSPFVSNYIDENFNDSLFLWDTAFMTMFCNYGHPYVPGIQSLDNFYCTQLEDGEIVREVSEITGAPNPASQPGTPDSLNHPILAWAEREAYRLSGDRRRLATVYEPLRRYYRAYEKIRDEASGFYRTSWASMDNSPRLDGGRLACGIDTTAQMVLFARDLAYIARRLDRDADAALYEAEAAALAEKINRRLWDEPSGFYYDWAVGGRRHDVQTIAGFWPLLAGVATPRQAERLAAQLDDPRKFRRAHRVPTVAADQPGYHRDGHYWRGGVWTPTDTMVVRGLERYGRDAQARDIALNHLDNVVEIFRRTGTVWEYYAPDAIAPGKDPAPRRDFVGWTGVCPIVYLIEYAVGIRADAPSNTVTWELRSEARCGVERLWFGGTTASLVSDPPDGDGRRVVRVQSDRAFRLVVSWKGRRTGRNIAPGASQSFTVAP